MARRGKRGDTLAEHFGNYLEIDRPRKLVFTFGAERGEEASRVCVEFSPVPNGCELTLTHDMDPKWAEYAGRTKEGWTKILRGLAVALDG